MQLRLGIQARATTDLDVVFRGRLDDWLDRFDEATAGVEWNGFTLTRKKPPQVIEVPGVGYQPWRVPLQLRYEGNEFGSVSLEVAIDEQTAAHHELVTPTVIPLRDFEIEVPGQIPCLDIPYQIAQKLHACTEPIEGGNPRVRDVIDIWLIERLLNPADIDQVRVAVTETFRRRQKRVSTFDPLERDLATRLRHHRRRPARRRPAVRRSNRLSDESRRAHHGELRTRLQFTTRTRPSMVPM
jgi:Nucleotidyl transferase AbiEii toxin, Type IV TA system